MSRTKRRTKNTDKQHHVFSLYYGEHFMYDWKGRQKFESNQAMYDEAVEKRDEDVLRYHQDRYKWGPHNDHVKAFVRCRNARAKVNMAMRKVFVSQDFDGLNFNKEEIIHSEASWNRY